MLSEGVDYFANLKSLISICNIWPHSNYDSKSVTFKIMDQYHGFLTLM